MRRAINLISCVSMLACSGMSAYASDTSTTDPATAADQATASSVQRLLKGVDADGDGIRDDLASLIETIDTNPATAESSKVRAEIDTAIASSASPKAQAPRRGCLDYLLLDPQQQAAANRNLQNQTSGAFGTHPCDPVTSPFLDRPFDTSVAELPLGPVKVQYAKQE